MKPLKRKEPIDDDELIRRMYKSAKQPRTPEEKREQRTSFVLSAVGRFDEKTRNEVEKVVDETYG